MTEDKIRAMVREEMEKVTYDVALGVVTKAMFEVVSPLFQTPAFKKHVADIAISACKNASLRNS